MPLPKWNLPVPGMSLNWTPQMQQIGSPLNAQNLAAAQAQMQMPASPIAAAPSAAPGPMPGYLSQAARDGGASALLGTEWYPKTLAEAMAMNRRGGYGRGGGGGGYTTSGRGW